MENLQDLPAVLEEAKIYLEDVPGAEMILELFEGQWGDKVVLNDDLEVIQEVAGS